MIKRGPRDWENSGNGYTCEDCGEKYIDKKVNVNLRYSQASGGMVADLDNLNFQPAHSICRMCFWKKEEERTNKEKIISDEKWGKLVSLFGNPPTAIAIKQPMFGGEERVLGEVEFYKSGNQIVPRPNFAGISCFRKGDIEIRCTHPIFLG